MMDYKHSIFSLWVFGLPYCVFLLVCVWKNRKRKP